MRLKWISLSFNTLSPMLIEELLDIQKPGFAIPKFWPCVNGRRKAKL